MVNLVCLCSLLLDIKLFLKLQEFLQFAYIGFTSPEPILQPKQTSLNNTVNVRPGPLPGPVTLPGQIDKKRVVVVTEETRKSSDQLWEKVAPEPVRLRQCCRNGCPNVCLSTTPANSRFDSIKVKRTCKNLHNPSKVLLLSRNFLLYTKFIVNYIFLQVCNILLNHYRHRVKEFCSPNCSMKSGRRNTVENFDLLPNFVEEAAALSTGVAVASRYHTLPHKLSSAKKNKSKEDASRKTGSPPKVPPHQHLINNGSPRFDFYFTKQKTENAFLFFFFAAIFNFLKNNIFFRGFFVRKQK